MKKVILLLLIFCSTVVAQDQWNIFWSGKQNIDTNVTPPAPSFTPIIPIPIVDTSIIPLANYQDLYLDINPAQVLSYYTNFTVSPTLYNLIMNSGTPDFEIGFDMKMDLSSSVSAINLFGYSYISGIQNFVVYARFDSIYCQIHDSTYNWGKQVHNENVWKTWKINYTAPVLSVNIGGTEVFSHATTFADTVGTFDSLVAFTFGGAGLKNNMAPSELVIGATAHIGLDNVYFIINGDTTSKCNFNDGSPTQPASSGVVVTVDTAIGNSWWWNMPKNQDNHGIYSLNPWLGLTQESYSGDTYTAKYLVRSGDRKDTNYWQPIPPTDTVGNRGANKWSSALGYYVGGTINRVIPKPSDPSTVLCVGSFTGFDTNNTCPQHIALLHDDSLISIGSGLEDNYLYGAVWGEGDTCVYVMRLSSEGWYQIVKVQVNSGTVTKPGDPDTIPYPAGGNSFKFFQNKLYALNVNSELWVYDPSTDSWSVPDTFAIDRKPLPYNANPEFLQMGEDSLFVLVSGYGVYNINPATGRKNLVCPMTDPYDAVPWNFSSCYDTASGRIYVGLINVYPYTGVVRGMSYYKAGQFVSLFSVDSCDARSPVYGDTTGHGMFRPAVFASCMWHGELIGVGQFRKANGKIVNNAFMWDSVRGVQPLDYGPEWNTFGVCPIERTDNGTIYTDLIMSGDWVAVNGVRYNHIATRLSPQHFAVIKPTIDGITAIADSIYKMNYPPTLTYRTYSSVRRAITAQVKYQINYNGSWNTITASKTDSALNPNLRGYWTFNYTATFTGDSSSVSVGDTVSYYILSTDNLGNKDSTTTYTVRIVDDPLPIASLVPDLTSNVSAYPIVVSRSSQYSTYDIWQAFSADTTANADAWIANPVPAWWIVNLSTAKTLTSYAITGFITASAGVDPKSWIIYGSNDSTNWDGLDTVTNEAAWGNLERKSFTIDSPASYQYYKMEISAAEDNGAYVGAVAIKLYGY